MKFNYFMSLITSVFIYIYCTFIVFVNENYYAFPFMIVTAMLMFTFAVSTYPKKEKVIISDEICDACGKEPKAPNSQICKVCQDKVKE